MKLIVADSQDEDCEMLVVERGKAENGHKLHSKVAQGKWAVDTVVDKLLVEAVVVVHRMCSVECQMVQIQQKHLKTVVSAPACQIDRYSHLEAFRQLVKSQLPDHKSHFEDDKEDIASNFGSKLQSAPFPDVVVLFLFDLALAGFDSWI